MEQKELARLASRLMSCPTAPYHEAGVRGAVETICAEHELPARRDAFGNVIVQLGHARLGRPIAFAAHLDHPGFSIERRLGPKRWLARFHGTVPDRYFKPGVRVRLLPGGIVSRLRRRRGKDKCFELAAETDLSPSPEFGVWEMNDFALRRGRIHGRACDDLLGVASALAALIDLKRKGAPVHVLALISRAEEVGFQGALALAGSKLIPKNTLILSLETSKEVPPVRMGRGVIVRVGDRSSIFGSEATRFITEVAAALAGRKPAFQYQRALMSGGTCEATAYQEHGYETAAVCVALGNYHNGAPDGRIREEFIDLDDLGGMTRLLAECALRMKDYPKLVGKLPHRLNQLLRTARVQLRRRPG